MTFSDSDWTRDPPRRPSMAPAQQRALTLAVAIALSCVAIALAVYGLEQLLDANARSEALRRVADGAAASAAATSEPAPAVAVAPAAAASVAPAAPVAASAVAPRSEDDIDRQQLAALEAEMKQRAREAAAQAAAEAVRRKERAWERWYQRPAFCNDNPTAAQMVQCANHHIRARKEFEERYAAGRIGGERRDRDGAAP